MFCHRSPHSRKGTQKNHKPRQNHINYPRAPTISSQNPYILENRACLPGYQDLPFSISLKNVKAMYRTYIRSILPHQLHISPQIIPYIKPSKYPIYKRPSHIHRRLAALAPLAPLTLALGVPPPPEILPLFSSDFGLFHSKLL